MDSVCVWFRTRSRPSWLHCYLMSLQVSISRVSHKNTVSKISQMEFQKAVPTFSAIRQVCVVLRVNNSVFHFPFSRWGKERPLNSRLLMQDVCLPDYDFSPMSHLPDNEAWNVQVFRSITSDAARLIMHVCCISMWQNDGKQDKSEMRRHIYRVP